MSECGKHQTGEIGWGELLSLVRQQCGRVPAWDDPDLDFLGEAHRVQYFSNLVHLWIVKPVQALKEYNRHDPDFGFALLTSVNAIPELLGKLLIGKANGHPYNKGVEWALGCAIDSQSIDSIRNAIRNAMAHNAIIEGNTENAVASLNNEFGLPVSVVKDKSGKATVCISPDKFAQALVDGLYRYIYTLRYEINADRRDKICKFNDYLEKVKVEKRTAKHKQD